MHNKRIKTCVCATGLTAASHFKIVFIRVKNFKNEKFVILEQKLDDEGLFASIGGLFQLISNWFFLISGTGLIAIGALQRENHKATWKQILDYF